MRTSAPNPYQRPADLSQKQRALGDADHSVSVVDATSKALHDRGTNPMTEGAGTEPHQTVVDPFCGSGGISPRINQA